MCLTRQYLLFAALFFIAAATACKRKPDKKAIDKTLTIKGLYTFEPGVKTFTPCGKSNQFGVADSSAQLELQYAQIVNFEQQGTAVFIEVEGKFTAVTANSEASAFDSILVVKKLIKITKAIPADCK